MNSLRSRLVLLLVALAAAASLAATGIAYAATDHQLSAQIDASIERAAARYVAEPAPGANKPLGQRPAPPPQGTFPPANLGPGPGRPIDAFDLVIAQQIGPGGNVVGHFSTISLPVNSTDRTVVSGAVPSALRTEEIDGSPYRIITVGLRNGGAIQVAESLLPEVGVLGSLRWRFGALLVILVLVAGGVAWLIARRITTPLEQLTEAAEAVAENGALDRPVPTSGRDEVGRLGRSFAAMLAALQRSKAQQQQLVRDAGHELRTPLTSIRSNIDLLRRYGKELSEPAMDRLLADLDAELRELSGLTDEVVELAVDARAAEPASTVRVDDLVTTAVARVRSRYGREVLLDCSPWSIEAPPRALERAFSNVLENAVKFSPAGQPIEVLVSAGAIAVRDHGPGFADADLPHVFDRFYRSERARSLPGSGLGLAIVRQIVEELGGSVIAANGEGGGALVRIELPGAAETIEHRG